MAVVGLGPLVDLDPDGLPLFGLRRHLSLFGPIKYGILPDHLRTPRAAARPMPGSRARTFIAILRRHHRRRPRLSKGGDTERRSAA